MSGPENIDPKLLKNSSDIAQIDSAKIPFTHGRLLSERSNDNSEIVPPADMHKIVAETIIPLLDKFIPIDVSSLTALSTRTMIEEVSGGIVKMNFLRSRLQIPYGTQADPAIKVIDQALEKLREKFVDCTRHLETLEKK